jgi:hypothetical protein
MLLLDNAYNSPEMHEFMRLVVNRFTIHKKSLGIIDWENELWKEYEFRNKDIYIDE